MASQHPNPPHSGISSQAGLAALRARSAAPAPLPLLALIDAYATARADRDESYREHAGWTFDLAHGAMLTARAAVADALGIPAAQIPDPADPISRRAAERSAAQIGGAR